MSQILTERPAVSVDELKRAWAAVQAGQFRPRPGTLRAPGAAARPATGSATVGRWATAGPVLPVLGCGGSTGATTLAVALATAIGAPARMVECASRTATGLAAASTAELGTSGKWIRGTRDQVVLERLGDVLTGLREVPDPLPAQDDQAATVLDLAWEMGQVLTTPGWMDTVVRTANPVVLTATATVPGLRRLEVALDLLAGTPVVAAVRGPDRGRWAKAVRHSTGPLTRSLECEGRLVPVPLEASLGVHGLTGDPLPKRLLAAAARLLRLVPDITTKGKP